MGKGEARDLLETRADLEVLACGRAAERRSEDDVAALQELLEWMHTSDREHFADADVAFHAKIAELAGNGVLTGWGEVSELARGGLGAARC